MRDLTAHAGMQYFINSDNTILVELKWDPIPVPLVIYIYARDTTHYSIFELIQLLMFHIQREIVTTCIVVYVDGCRRAMMQLCIVCSTPF